MKNKKISKIISILLLFGLVAGIIPGGIGNLKVEAAGLEMPQRIRPTAETMWNPENIKNTIAAGGRHSLFITQTQTVKAVGRNDRGQLGNGTTNDSLEFVDVLGKDGVGLLTDIVAISAGYYYSLALKSDGTVWSWGDNEYGQLGDGTTTKKTTPVQVKGGESGKEFLTDIVAILAGHDHSLALKADGTVWAWGKNSYGQLGDGTTVDKTTPVQVKGGESGKEFLTNIVAISAGYYHSLALKADGTVWAWGKNSYGQLGDGTTVDKTTPVQVKGGESGKEFLTNIVAISAGGYHSLALKADGTVWSWGYNDSGQLGNNSSGQFEDGTTNRKLSPVQVKGGESGKEFLTNIVAISAGGYHSLALKADGTIWAWGENYDGQLGNKNTIEQNTPVRTLLPSSLSEDDLTLENFLKEWTNQNVIITATTTDAIEKIILPDNTEVSGKTATYMVSENGTYTFKAVDADGNEAEKSIKITNIDKTAPTLELTQEPKEATNEDVTININANDDLSGIKEIILPDGTKSTDATTYVVSENRIYEFKVTDNAGNITTKSIEISNINKTAPVITIEPYNTNWTNKDITVTAKTDKGSLNETNHIFTENGSFEFIATDDIGNISKKTVTITNIDKIVPELSLTADITNPTNKDVVITAKGTDTASGIKEITLPDGSKAAKDTAIYTVNQNGTYEFKVTDNAGNVTTKSIEVSNIDKIAPIISIEPYNTNWTNKDITVTAKTDKGSLNETNHIFTENGNFEFIATDALGNVSKRTVTITNIDKTAPTKPSLTETENKITLHSGIDSLSGIDKHVYSLNNGQWTEWDNDIDLTGFAAGNYIIKVKAVDKAGNESEADIFEFTVIDKIKKIEDDIKDAEDEDDLDDIQDKIDKLPDGPEKDKLQDEINKKREELKKNNAEKEAIQAVELAEALKREPYIQRAKDKVALLPDSELKTSLEERLLKLEESLNQDSKETIKTAENLVKIAETLRREPHITRAKEAVNKLKPSEKKTELLLRLQTLEESLSDSGKPTPEEEAVIKATQAVEMAEEYKYASLIRVAEKKVNELPESEEKNALLKRISSLTTVNANRIMMLKKAAK